MYRRLSISCLASTAAAAIALASGTATAATAPLSNPRTLAHFDLSTGQSPENIALDPDGSALVGLTGSRQVARVSPTGHTTVLATLPGHDSPAGQEGIAGLVRAGDGSVHVAYRSGDANLNGVWRIPPSGAPERVAALPVGVALNGLTVHRATGVLYGADSSNGTVWRIPTRAGAPEIWSSDPALKPGTSPTSYGFGANGIKVHRGAVWVSNSDAGTLLRLPVRPGGSAGPVETRATGLTGVDDFSFIGNTDTALAALNSANEVALVEPDGSHAVVLTGQDGLRTPTATAVRGGTVYVTSAAYFTQEDPNLLLADLDPR